MEKFVAIPEGNKSKKRLFARKSYQCNLNLYILAMDGNQSHNASIVDIL